MRVKVSPFFSILSNLTRSRSGVVFLLSALLGSGLIGCTPESGEPTSTELIQTRPPTFYGQGSKSFTFPSTTIQILGECDPISKGIEYSFDENSWTNLSSGCVNSAFTLNVVIPRSSTIYVRALTKKGFTASAKAIVRLELPPTSQAYQTVTAGNAMLEGSRGVQFTMSSGLEGKPGTGTNFKVNSHVTGVVYGE